MGRVGLDFFEHSPIGSDDIRKSAPLTTMGILYRIIIFCLTHKDLIMDSITIFPNKTSNGPMVTHEHEI